MLAMVNTSLMTACGTKREAHRAVICLTPPALAWLPASVPTAPCTTWRLRHRINKCLGHQS
eukprot:scaffold103742_cov24-Prasinocladus_malaysianus.AAC.1